jgi:hypothetical protein
MTDVDRPNELDEYLSHPIEKVRDPIGWWWDHRKQYPTLSQMALDFLSVPGKFLLILMSLMYSESF